MATRPCIGLNAATDRSSFRCKPWRWCAVGRELDYGMLTLLDSIGRSVSARPERRTIGVASLRSHGFDVPARSENSLLRPDRSGAKLPGLGFGLLRDRARGRGLVSLSWLGCPVL